MEITVLPNDLKIKESENVQIFNYRSGKDLDKSKISLAKHTISFLRSGTKEVIGDDKTIKIDRQSFVVMKAGNCLMTEKVSASDRVYKSVLLFFSNVAVIDFLERHHLLSDRPKAPNPKSFYRFQYDPFIETFVESLEKALILPHAFQTSILKSKFEEVMLYLTFRYGADFLNSLVQQVDDSIIQLRKVVENNRHTKLSLQELAFLANMSVSTFKRAFYKQYHTTPIKWFNEERLKHIAVLLRTNQHRPIEVYEAAGYESFSNFVQAFKKHFGQTPKQYQAQF